jgi:hypothetical protein
MEFSCVFEKYSFQRYLQTVHSNVTVKSSVTTVNSSISSLLRAKRKTPRMVATVPAKIIYMSSNSIPKPIENGFAQRKSYKAERSKNETPEVQAANNATIIGVNPKRVSTQPKMRLEFRATIILRMLLAN